MLNKKAMAISFVITLLLFILATVFYKVFAHFIFFFIWPGLYMLISTNKPYRSYGETKGGVILASATGLAVYIFLIKVILVLLLGISENLIFYPPFLGKLLDW